MSDPNKCEAFFPLNGLLDLGTTDMKISSLAIPDCCSAPCILKRGTNVSVTIQFKTDKNFVEMTQMLCGEFGACVRLPSLPTDFCKYTTCPIEAGKVYTAKVELPVLKEYPPVGLPSTSHSHKSTFVMSACV